jgi:hypothetical protein
MCRDLSTVSRQREPVVAATWPDAEAEHAATVEHDAGIPRAWAEGFARLHPDGPPGDVPLKRWLTFIGDVGRFLDSPFCAVAVALGWGAPCSAATATARSHGLIEPGCCGC